MQRVPVHLLQGEPEQLRQHLEVDPAVPDEQHRTLAQNV